MTDTTSQYDIAIDLVERFWFGGNRPNYQGAMCLGVAAQHAGIASSWVVPEGHPLAQAIRELFPDRLVSLDDDAVMRPSAPIGVSLPAFNDYVGGGFRLTATTLEDVIKVLRRAQEIATFQPTLTETPGCQPTTLAWTGIATP